MAPKAVVYHICGQHLCGEAVVGYAVGPDTPIMLAPKLILGGGIVVRNAPTMEAPTLNLISGAGQGSAWNPVTVSSPALVLQGRATGIAISVSMTAGKPSLFLNGGPHIVGKEKAMVPTQPGNILLDPTSEEAILLPPTVEADWLLTPTTEREM